MTNIIIERSIRESIAVKQAVWGDPVFLQKIEQAAHLLVHTFQAGGKV